MPRTASPSPSESSARRALARERDARPTSASSGAARRRAPRCRRGGALSQRRARRCRHRRQCCSAYVPRPHAILSDLACGPPRALWRCRHHGPRQAPKRQAAGKADRAGHVPIEAAFHKWLAANHDRVDELIVRCFKAHAADRGLTYRQALDEALCFGWIEGVRRALDEDSFTQRFTPRRKGSKWSAVNVRRTSELEAEGRLEPPGLAAFQGRRATPAGYILRIPRRGRAVASVQPGAAADARASAWLAAQAPWYRRTAAFWVMSAKKDETRARRFEASVVQKSAPASRYRRSRGLPRARRERGPGCAVRGGSSAGRGARCACPPRVRCDRNPVAGTWNPEPSWGIRPENEVRAQASTWPRRLCRKLCRARFRPSFHAQPQVRAPHALQVAVRDARRHRLAGARDRRQRRHLLAVQPDAAARRCRCRSPIGWSISPRRGRSRARNRAATPASCDVVLQLPDVPRPRAGADAVHRHRRAPRLQREPGLPGSRRTSGEGMLVSGSLLPRARRPPGARPPARRRGRSRRSASRTSRCSATATGRPASALEPQRPQRHDHRQRPEPHDRRRRRRAGSTGRRSACSRRSSCRSRCAARCSPASTASTTAELLGLRCSRA